MVVAMLDGDRVALCGVKSVPENSVKACAAASILRALRYGQCQLMNRRAGQNNHGAVVTWTFADFAVAIERLYDSVSALYLWPRPPGKAVIRPVGAS